MLDGYPYVIRVPNRLRARMVVTEHLANNIYDLILSNMQKI